jgi:sulfur carrier protein
MILHLNGERREVASATLDQLLAELGLEPETVATAVNREFVPRAERGEIQLSEGDAVELLSPMQGG